MQPIQLTPNEGSKQGVLAAINNLNGVRNGLNEVISANSLVDSAAEKNQNEVKNAVLLHKRLLQGQQQASTASGLYSLQKQSFDFLSFSAGDGGMEANNYTSRAGNGLEPFTQFHVPYLQFLAQNHTAVPSSLSENRYSSTPFPDHLSTAAAQQGQLQLPPLLGSPFCGLPHLGTTISPRQQQQQIWAAQLATRCKKGGVAAPHISNWPNGRQESPSMIQYAQAILPPSQSSLELLGPKYAPISQQPQQLVAITSSLPTARVRRQHHHLPSGYEGNGGGFYPDSAPSLQLLCNEHL
ncbi:hypothetical protein F0562_027131 [Nyssa sinensis]|uniref:Uncharacterized protein n=1 Tax=Nyssa sinensis TaxID=561372 RepID=A0A5J5B2Q6_9ASTE|nr:hypothetical protein F0562_027131 [Nyssa sinensis]